MSRVIVLPCADYEDSTVFAAIEEGITLLGGLELFFRTDEKILLKPNLLAKVAPEKACTTHPAVFSAVGRYLKEQGFNNLTYGDSSGNALFGLDKTADVCGIKAAAEALNIPPGNFSEGVPIDFPEGRVERHFPICPGVLEADAIINICKMKAHALERVTGAVKNIFGAVYGFNKGAFHGKYTSAETFAAMLIDLNLLIKPRLHIMDGIVAMEGNGPQSGDPVNMNLILMSADPVALDTIFCHLIHLEPALVPTNAIGNSVGIGTMDTSKIEIMTSGGKLLSVAEAVDIFGKLDFDVRREHDYLGNISWLNVLLPFIDNRPVIDSSRCKGCGICINSCPLTPRAIAFPQVASGKRRSVPVYDNKACVKCFCCQEMCPEKAISVKTPRLAKLLKRNWKL